MTDPYQILGVPRTASADQMKSAYRKLAKQWHPDLHPDDPKVEDRFKEISAAYGLLSDPEMRARYDRGEIDEAGQEKFARQFHAQGGFGGFNAEDLFADLFSGGFGGRGQRGPRRGPRRGQDQRYKVTVGFQDSALGTTQRVTLPGGKSLDVTVPAGIEDGQTIRLKGQGQPGAGAGAPPGDALIEVTVRPDKQFTRKANDIYLDLPVDLATAVLGGKVEVPTVYGAVTMTIPKGANSGDTLRLKGKGIVKGKAAGNQYVRVQIMLPDPADSELIDAVAAWAESRSAAKTKA